MNRTRGFDWPGLLRAGVRGLGLSPAAFWALTPYELLLLLGIEGAEPPMARARLEELSQAYPDASLKEDGDERD